MWWNKKQVKEIIRPKVGELWQITNFYNYEDCYLYFTETETPTLEGPGYMYVFFDKDGKLKNKKAVSKLRHVDDTIDENCMVKIKDERLIAKFSLLT